MSNLVLPCPLKRYAIMVLHEVIVYDYEEARAKATALRAYSSRGAQCISIRELPPVEVEAAGVTVIDKRSAPGQ